MKRLEAGIADKRAQWSNEAGVAAARILHAGGQIEHITYPTGLQRVKVIGPTWATEISPKQYRYLVKWDNQIGPHFPQD